SRRRHTRSLRDWSSDVCSSDRSEEHTSELQSRRDLVCRLLLDKSSDVCSRSEEHTSELQSRRDLVCRLLLANTSIVSGVRRCSVIWDFTRARVSLVPTSGMSARCLSRYVFKSTGSPWAFPFSPASPFSS